MGHKKSGLRNMIHQFVIIGRSATNIMKSFILASFLALSFMAVTEVHGWYGYHYGYWPRYYSHGGKVLGPVKMENVDYGKTKIKYLKKRSVKSLGYVPIKMENVDYGKTKIKFLEKRSVKVIHPANIKMENVDYGKTKIKFLKKR